MGCCCRSKVTNFDIYLPFQSFVLVLHTVTSATCYLIVAVLEQGAPSDRCEVVSNFLSKISILLSPLSSSTSSFLYAIPDGLSLMCLPAGSE